MGNVFLESCCPGDGGWLKGNLHAHSTRSDGRLSPQDLVRLYADAGYDFLMLTDHDVPADLDGLDPCGVVLLAGNEVSAAGPHVLHAGASRRVEPGPRQRVLDAINADGDGGFAVLCHPNWREQFDHFPIDQLRTLSGYAGVEIFNGGVDWSPGDGLALAKWDMLLSSGRRVWGFATDDLHSPGELGRGWVMVRARRDGRSILDALRSGAFYASTGVTIQAIECDGPTVRIVAPDAEGIAVIGSNGQRLVYADASELSYQADGQVSPFVRLDCFGRGHRRAWTQPLFVRGELIDRLNRLLAERPLFPLARASRSVRLSGRLDDPQWADAEPVTRFHAAPSAEPGPVATEVRGLLDSDSLVLGFRCQEPRMESLKVTADPGARAIWADDSIEVFIDPDNAARGYWHVMVNAAGHAAAEHSDGRTELPGLRAAAGRYDGGWTVELAIPLAALGGPEGGRPRPGARCGFNVHRNRVAAQPAHLSWSWVGRTYHNPAAFGLLSL